MKISLYIYSFCIFAFVNSVAVGQDHASIMIDVEIDNQLVTIPKKVLSGKFFDREKLGKLVIERKQFSDNCPSMNVHVRNYNFLEGAFIGISGTCERQECEVCMPKNCAVDYESTDGKGYKVVVRRPQWNFEVTPIMSDRYQEGTVRCLVSYVKVCKTGLWRSGGEFHQHHVLYGKCGRFE